jgi:prepilin-type N-terminal cleavage/methylation domain-containing protein
MFSRFTKKMRRAFTLVEIMIVVLIIGILLAIAIPNFIRARETSRAKSCQSNLQHVDSAKEQWAMDNKKTATDTAPASTDLSPTYVKTYPACPSNGTYTIGAVGTTPVCSVGTNGSTDTALQHVLQ